MQETPAIPNARVIPSNITCQRIARSRTCTCNRALHPKQLPGTMCARSDSLSTRGEGMSTRVQNSISARNPRETSAAPRLGRQTSSQTTQHRCVWQICTHTPGVASLEFGVWDSEFGIWGLGLRVWDLGFGIMVQGEYIGESGRFKGQNWEFYTHTCAEISQAIDSNGG